MRRITSRALLADEAQTLYRPLKKLTSCRIDADVLEWLKSKGPGHLRRVNEILRSAMIADREGPRTRVRRG